MLPCKTPTERYKMLLRVYKALTERYKMFLQVCKSLTERYKGLSRIEI